MEVQEKIKKIEMSKTNTLTSHHGESMAHRADKMSGLPKGSKKMLIGVSKKDIKKFTRRGFLKNEKFFDKI